MSETTPEASVAEVPRPGDELPAPTPGAGGSRGRRKTREGYVVSAKTAKTIVVEVEDRVQHPRYSKTIRRSSKVATHDEAGIAGVGDRVLIMETRPLSATKRWRIVEVLERAQ